MNDGAMQGQVQRERLLMEKQWYERESPFQCVIGSMLAMYGVLQGIVSGGPAASPALELDGEQWLNANELTHS